MPEYRDIKEPTRLATQELTEDEQAIVDAGGNEAAAGVLDSADEPTQLNIWWKNDNTYVQPWPVNAKFPDYKLTGYISPQHVSAEYLHRYYPEKVAEDEGGFNAQEESDADTE